MTMVEKLDELNKNGRIIGYKFVSHGANEALDCTVYAMEAKEVYMYEESLLHNEEDTNYRKFFDWISTDPAEYPDIKELEQRKIRLIEILYGKKVA